MANVKDIRVYEHITRENYSEANTYMLKARTGGRFSKDGRFPFELDAEADNDGTYTLTLTYDPEFNFEEYAQDKNAASRNKLPGRFVAIGEKIIGKSEPDANGNQQFSSKFTALDPNFTSEQIAGLTLADENADYLKDASHQMKECRCACCQVSNPSRAKFTILAEVDDDGFTGNYYQVGNNCAEKFGGKRSSRELFNSFISKFEEKAGVMKEGRFSDGQTLIRADELMAHAITVSHLNEIHSERELISKTKEMYYKTDEELAGYTIYMDEYARSMDELHLMANMKASDGQRFGDVFDKQFDAQAVKPLIKDLCSVYKEARDKPLYSRSGSVSSDAVTKFTEIQWGLVMSDAAIRVEKSGENTHVRKTFVDSGNEVEEKPHYRYKGDDISRKPASSFTDSALEENASVKAVCGFNSESKRVYYLGTMDPRGMNGKAYIYAPDTEAGVIEHQTNIGKSVDVRISDVANRGKQSVSVYEDQPDNGGARLYRKYSPHDLIKASRAYSVAHNSEITSCTADDIRAGNAPQSVQVLCMTDKNNKPCYCIGLQDDTDRSSNKIQTIYPAGKEDKGVCVSNAGRKIEYPAAMMCDMHRLNMSPKQLCDRNRMYNATAQTSIRAVRAVGVNREPVYRFMIHDRKGKDFDVSIKAPQQDKHKPGDTVWLNVVNQHKKGTDPITISCNGADVSVPRQNLAQCASDYRLRTNGSFSADAGKPSERENAQWIKAFCCWDKNGSVVYKFGMWSRDMFVPCARVYASSIGREPKEGEIGHCVNIKLHDGVKLYGKDSDGVNISSTRWKAVDIKRMADCYRDWHDGCVFGSTWRQQRTEHEATLPPETNAYDHEQPDDGGLE